MSGTGTPGWFDDPVIAGQERLWDGTAWTNNVRPRVADPGAANPPPYVPPADLNAMLPSIGVAQPSTEKTPAAPWSEVAKAAAAPVILILIWDAVTDFGIWVPRLVFYLVSVAILVAFLRRRHIGLRLDE